MSKNYEELRAKNIQDNKRILAELGLLNPFLPLPKVRKNKIVKKKPEEKKPEEKPDKYVVTDEKTKPEDLEGYGSVYSDEKATRATRSSSRLRGKKVDFSDAMLDQAYEEAEEEMEERREKRRVLANRPMVYGPIPGVEVGTWWATRMECNHDGIHRPTVAGIHPGPKGAYSIALSGGYEDDIDMGDCFTYTGEGGRDLKGTASNPKNLRTAPQSKDQCLSRGNMALKVSSETNFPIRVIRGYKSDSPFAPEEGYRYDGLYKCEKAWYTVGLAGFGVWKFALRRLEDQAPPPWTIEGEEGSEEKKQDSDGEKAENDAQEKVEVKEEKTENKEDGDKKNLGNEKTAKNEDEEEKVTVKEEVKEVQKEKTEVKEEEDDVKDKETDGNVEVELKEEEKKAKSKESEKKEGLKEDPTSKNKEQNNNEAEVKSKEAKEETKPMKELQTTKNESKKRKRSKRDDDDDDFEEEEVKKKKPRTEAKKEKKEKENAAMSKGLMGWLIKTP